MLENRGIGWQLKKMPQSQCGPPIERLCWVFPAPSGSGYAVLIGFYRDRCESPWLQTRLPRWLCCGGPHRRLNCTCETTPAGNDYSSALCVKIKYLSAFFGADLRGKSQKASLFLTEFPFCIGLISNLCLKFPERHFVR